MKRAIGLLLSLCLLGGLIAWRLNLKKQEAAAQGKQREMRMKSVPMVTLAPAEKRDVVHTFEAVGTVGSPFVVKIAGRVTGNIVALTVQEGDRVTKGQMLARIDPADAASAMRQAQANLVTAKARLAEARTTQNATGVEVTSQIRQQEAALANANAELQQTRENSVSQQAAAQAAIAEAQSRIRSADAALRTGQAAIRSAQANLDNARAKYSRVQGLYQQGFIAAQEVDDAKAAVNVQEAAVDGAKSQLETAQANREAAVSQRDIAQRQAEIVATQSKADIEAARTKVAQAQAALDLARANTARRPAYRQNLAALESGVVMAKGAIVSAKSRMEDTQLTSPLDGLVTARYLDQGAMVTTGVPILEVASVRQVWVTVPVPEEVSRKVTQSQAVEVTFDALPGRPFSGQVTQIIPTADPQSRQVSVRITLDNPQSLLKPGMFARATFVTERVAGATVVPREAIQRDKSGAGVVVVSADGVAQRRPVTLGVSDAHGIALTEGLQPGEKVVVLSASPIKDGQKVQERRTSDSAEKH